MARHRKPEPDLDVCWDHENITTAAVGAVTSAPAVDPHPAAGEGQAETGEWAAVPAAAPHAPRHRRGGAHRQPTPARPGGRAMVLSMATGALLAAGTSTAHAAPADPTPQASEVAPQPAPDPIAAALAAVPQVLQIPETAELSKFTDQLAKAREREAERLAREAADRAARTPQATPGSGGGFLRPPGTSIAPVSGTLTSNYGARWGTTHYGLDIANDIGTPIVSVTDGTVLEAGPASGFGMWVRILQDDGTVGVFGHINEALVTAGQKVRAGQQIATVGNRGQSTGPHLHYEVWQADGMKTDPMAWLRARGINMTSSD
ncbi:MULTISPECIES: M23 family metallopeptidase [Rhodococcus]|uniref:Peptidase M23 family protein n=1 Tax=Rhodococcus opacus RKJ300 = JCM 13270 TaxID=1165867 RepID=I0WY42_RHOOP|nr:MULTISPECIES: M23 family metallopeptidase [Rhodococcus]EID81308.1 peptidase M23 family protein [Rhodococcus opacus RKJ300 = JCM 13270]KAF0965089.1 hypothetical protein MLGJGCBP_01758 [Rhodococcus sp. T7]